VAAALGLHAPDVAGPAQSAAFHWPGCPRLNAPPKQKLCCAPRSSVANSHLLQNSPESPILESGPGFGHFVLLPGSLHNSLMDVRPQPGSVQPPPLRPCALGLFRSGPTKLYSMFLRLKSLELERGIASCMPWQALGWPPRRKAKSRGEKKKQKKKKSDRPCAPLPRKRPLGRPAVSQKSGTRLVAVWPQSFHFLPMRYDGLSRPRMLNTTVHNRTHWSGQYCPRRLPFLSPSAPLPHPVWTAPFVSVSVPKPMDPELGPGH
jgi:hypothetical protein